MEFTNVKQTGEPFRLTIGRYIVTVEGRWNGGSAILERRLRDGQAWMRVETTATWSADGAQEFSVVPSSAGGPYRLRLAVAASVVPVVDAVRTPADRAINHAAVVANPKGQAIAATIREHIATIAAAAKDGLVVDMQNAVTLALAQVLFLGAAVKSDEGGSRAVSTAEAALRALEPLSGPVVSMTIDPVFATPASLAMPAAALGTASAGATIH